MTIWTQYQLNEMAISRHTEERNGDYALLSSNNFFKVHCSIDSTAHSRHLNSLEDSICITNELRDTSEPSESPGPAIK